MKKTYDLPSQSGNRFTDIPASINHLMIFVLILIGVFIFPAGAFSQTFTSENLKPRNYRDISPILSNIKYYYCIINPRLTEMLKGECEKNSAGFEICRQFEHLVLWKRTGVIVTIYAGESNAEFAKELVEKWKASPFSDVEISFTLRAGGREAVYDCIYGYKKGKETIDFITCSPYGASSTLFPGLLSLKPDVFDSFDNIIRDPEAIVTMKAVNMLSREKMIMFYGEYIFEGELKIKSGK